MVDIPDDCWVHVFSFLTDKRDFLKAQLICKRFWQIAKHDKFWQPRAIAMGILGYCKDRETVLKLLPKITVPREVSWKYRVLLMHKWRKKTYGSGSVLISHRSRLEPRSKEEFPELISMDFPCQDKNWQCLGCLGTDITIHRTMLYWFEHIITWNKCFQVEILCNECQIFTLYSGQVFE